MSEKVVTGTAETVWRTVRTRSFSSKFSAPYYSTSWRSSVDRIKTSYIGIICLRPRQIIKNFLICLIERGSALNKQAGAQDKGSHVVCRIGCIHANLPIRSRFPHQRTDVCVLMCNMYLLIVGVANFT